ncbi:XTP/dITP diphosphatase [Lactobacillus sp. S2-2]|uniref:XTP/dITP diphosphatase n=1 Tax=Lactobacillus sp. S2-2 TaxID=2692917 RepID=UPI001F02D950|nr:XTP/dITP diphosphatase [Lactobacillus sp. S2-2]MCF6515821.1 XTP/dITP diphosphatase [Lactobacillus sp. S2-2]
MINKLVVASENKGKIKEFEELFKELNITIESLNKFDNLPVIIEDGKTFEDNARIKAKTIANALNVPVVADDSGLVVKALNGEPGIYSARYAGDHDDAANNRKLLKNMINKDNRDAFFQSTLVLETPDGKEIVANGILNGKIANQEKGRNGFGYDSLFVVNGKTLAEYSFSEKNKISHRRNAIENLKEKLKDTI